MPLQRAAAGRISLQVIAGRPGPTAGSAATYSTIVPNSASAMPTPQMRKNFHDASIASAVRGSPTTSTAAIVAVSTATQVTPRLLDSSASSMAPTNS